MDAHKDAAHRAEAWCAGGGGLGARPTPHATMADDPNHRQHGIETKGLTSKEAARLQVLTPEDSYAPRDRSEMSTRAIVYEMFEDPTSSTSVRPPPPPQP